MFPAHSPNVEHKLDYQELRIWIGILGMAMPVVLGLGGLFKEIQLQSSLSAYYHTNMHVAFIGTLWVIAFFMISYRGYENDWLWGDLAGLGALGVSIFPTGVAGEPGGIYSTIHFISAGLFFAMLILFSGYLFTKSKLPPDQRGPRKKLRNAIYRLCAAIMALCILAVILVKTLGDLDPDSTFVFWMESMAIFFFGISWFVKGEFILKDNPA